MQTFRPLGGSNYISAAYDYRDQGEHAATDNALLHSTHSLHRNNHTTKSITHTAYYSVTHTTRNMAFVSESIVSDAFSNHQVLRGGDNQCSSKRSQTDQVVTLILKNNPLMLVIHDDIDHVTSWHTWEATQLLWLRAACTFNVVFVRLKTISINKTYVRDI